jgi:hypothetical protein
LPAELLKTVTKRKGYVGLCASVSALVSRLQEERVVLEGKTGLTLEDLKRADIAARTLLEALALRDKPLERLAELKDLRRRAFTLFIHAYSEVRRAVLYLRASHGDAEKLTPSLYRRRHLKARKRREAAKAKRDAAGIVANNPESNSSAIA